MTAAAAQLLTPDQLPRLEWQVRHSVETMLSGDYRSVFRGRGMEFDQVVKYTWGDDPRDIDWNVTARLGEPYCKRFIEEREVSVVVVFEDSPALQFGSAGRTRRETLLELAVLLMLIGAQNRDRVGLLYVAPTDSWYSRPATGRAVTHTAARLLAQSAPPLDGPMEIEIPWHVILRAVSRQSVLVWAGPFAPAPEPADWGALGRRYQTVGFRADDPWDEALPANATLPVFDPVGGRVTQLNPSSASHREAHAAWTRRRNDHFSDLFTRMHDRVVLPTDQPVLPELVNFFHHRARLAAVR